MAAPVLPRVPLSVERLREVLAYDPATGDFTWLRDNTRIKAGQIAGGIDTHGYRQIKIDGRLYLAHRLAWLFVKGEWPDGKLDHRNTDQLDNRIDNLRRATDHESATNKGLTRANTSGFKGVCWRKDYKRWGASICVNRRKIHLGFFDTAEAAHEAYCKAALEHHGAFARTR